MDNRLPTEESFLRDVSEHRMEVRLDQGLYRHLRFQRPGSWGMGFDLTTWPGYLCISGDMGCYTFARIPDMFQFFRRDGNFPIDLRYWAEKAQAVDRCDGLKQYSPSRFRDAILRWLDNVEATDELREAVQDEVLSRAEDGEHEAVRAAVEFECGGFRFDGFWEVSVKEYSYRFVWACHAISWGVDQYDRARRSEEATA